MAPNTILKRRKHKVYFEFRDSRSNITDLVSLDDICHVDISYVTFDKYNIKILYVTGVVTQVATTEKQQLNFIKTLVYYKNNTQIN